MTDTTAPTRVRHEDHGEGTVLQRDGDYLLIQFDGEVCPYVGMHVEDIESVADAETIRSRAADVIEQHIEGRFKVRERAEGNTEDLHTAGLLRGGNARGTLPVQEQAVNVLQCRQTWKVAEAIAADLAAAGLLADEHDTAKG